MPRRVHSGARRAARLTRVLLAVLAAGCAPPDERRAASAAVPPIPSAERAAIGAAIVFVSERGGGRSLYVVRVRDGAERRLTSGWGDEFPGAISADGRRVAVVWSADSLGGHAEQIGVLALAAAGAGPRFVTPRSARVRGPSWSPDGAWLAFEGDMHGFRELYRVSAAGGDVRRLTRSREGNFEPAVSPDGRHIAFVSSRDGTNQIYRMRADGRDQRRLTAFHRDEWAPIWSPSGARIAFVSQREGADRLFVMRADGTGQRRLTSEAPVPGGAVGSMASTSSDRLEGEPAWSPDGTRLALVARTPGGEARVEVVDAASGRATPLPCPSTMCDSPAWSPDGRYLAFVSSAGGNADVYLSRADGTAQSRLTASPAADWLPRWVAGDGP